MTDDPSAAEERLIAFGQEHGIEHVPLTVFEGAEGPSSYGLDPEAETIVIVWVETTFQAVHNLPAGGIDEPAVERMLADIENALP